MLCGESLRLDEHFRKVIVGPRQSPCINIRPENPDRRRFLRLGDFTPKSLQADRVGNFNPVNMRENQGITRSFNDGDRLRGILLEDITFHENPGIDINAQVFPLS